MQVLPNLLTIIMFMTPIFYPIESMPGIVREFSIFNPFYILADAYRTAILQHGQPRLDLLACLFVLDVVIFLSGLTAFRRVKGEFTSAL